MKRLAILLLSLLCTSLTFIALSQDSTYISGQIIATDLIWTKANSPYVVSGDVMIKDSATLTIEAGTEIFIRPHQDENPQILFGNPSKVCIGTEDMLGSIIAIGTEAEPIKFKSLSGSQSNSDWTGLFTMGPKCQFEYMEIYDAEWGIDGSYIDPRDTLKINHCIFSNIEADGFRCGSHGAIVVIKNSLFQYCGIGITIYQGAKGIISNCTFKFNARGFECFPLSDVSFTENEVLNNEIGIQLGSNEQNQTSSTFRNNNIYDNVNHNVHNASPIDFDFQNNYWGIAGTSEMNSGSNPKNISGIYDKMDDSNLGLVNYAHWLDAPWPTGQPVGNTYTAELRFLDELYQEERLVYQTGESVYLDLDDPDQNTNGNSIDYVEVLITSDLEISGESMQLSETGINTGIFRGDIILDHTTGSQISDGSLQVNKGDWININYTDNADEWGGNTAINKEALFGATLSPKQSITTPMVFTKESSPYLVTGEHLLNGGSLTIEPGVTVYVEGPEFINSFGGNFYAKGTKQDSIIIIFRELYNSWSGILLYPYGEFEYCRIENFPVINLWDGSIVRNCVFKNSLRDWGLTPNGTCLIDSCHFINSELVLGNFNESIIQNSVFSDCQRAIHAWNGCKSIIQNNTIQDCETGIEISGDPVGQPVIRYNTISNNNYGIVHSYENSPYNLILHHNNINDNNFNFVNNNSLTDARFNYWGASATDEMETGSNPKNISTIFDIHDDPQKALVNYTHWLDAPWPDGIATETGNSGKLIFTNANGDPVGTYYEGAKAYIRLTDPDLNVNPVNQDTVSIKISSELESSPETLVLTESDDSTGIFIGSMSFDYIRGYKLNDGILQVDYNNSVWATYHDSLDDWKKVSDVTESVLFLSSESSLTAVDRNTILHATFDEVSGQILIDSSTYANHGNLGITPDADSRDAERSDFAYRGRALRFDSDDDLALFPFGDFDKNIGTVSMRVYLIQENGDMPLLSVTDSEEWSQECTHFMFRDDVLHDHTRHNIDWTGEWNVDIDLQPNTWNEVVLTWNGSNRKFFFNGQLIEENDFRVTPDLTSGHVIRIGDNPDNSVLNGYIDDVKISKIDRSVMGTIEPIPGRIGDLNVVDSSYTTITITWHSPGSDRYTGTCNIYDLRMSTSPIDSANFSNADSITGLPLPLIAGSQQTFTLEGLNSGSKYYFALKSFDDEGNWSPISNIAVGETPARYFTDERDGQKYKLQQIGYQTWMAENLNYYTPDGSWYYQNDSLSYADSLGRLYYWSTAMAADQSFNTTLLEPIYPTQGVCPSEWHIPTDADWQVLEKELGMDSSQYVQNGYRGTIEGDKLKYDSISGYDALPAGYRTETGDFTNLDTNYYFWTSSETVSAQSVYRMLDTSRSDIYRENYSKVAGMSVRCVQDIPPIAIELNKSDVSKVNGMDGIINATISGGIMPYTYSWSNGDSEEDISDLPPGTYILKVTDARDSTAVDSVAIFETYTDPRDDKIYKVVHLDGRVWMAENLNFNTGSGSSYYNNDSLSNHQFGRLYTWQTAMNACPTNWYLPIDEEWQNLEISLGMAPAEATSTDWRGTNEGDKLKDSGSSGFDAEMAGIFNGSTFVGIDNLTHFWTGSESGTDAWNRQLDNIHSTIERTLEDKGNAYSVRCILDTCALIDIEFAKTDISCFGVEDGSVDLTVSGGKEPYSYSWSNSADTNVIAGLGKGIYQLTVYDAVGCTKTDSINISEPPLLTTEITDSANISCYGFSDGTTIVTPSGGTATYGYRWDDISNTRDSTITGMSADRYYYVDITDANGCTTIDSIQLSQPDPLDVGLESQYQLCQQQTLDLTARTGFTEYNWSTGETTNQISVNTPGTYNLTVRDDDGCPGYGSVEVDLDFIYQGEEICLVTVSLAGKNMVVWEKAEGLDITGYNIYREGINFGSYNLLGTVPYESLSLFVDPDSDPRKKSYKYKISAVNSCGTESDLSFYHKTIHLQISLAIQGYNLNWVDYEYEAGGLQFTRYEIYRGSSVNNLQLIESISSSENSYTDRDAPEGVLYYQIAGLLSNPCSPSASKKSTEETYDYSYSNFEDNGQGTGLNSAIADKLIIYPNPATSEVRIDYPNPDNKVHHINLLDLSGRKIRTFGPISGNHTIINCENVTRGLYLIEIRGPKIYRGKIVLE